METSDTQPVAGFALMLLPTMIAFEPDILAGGDQPAASIPLARV
ncbi:hypothetical protein [Pararhodobacter sp.]